MGGVGGGGGGGTKVGGWGGGEEQSASGAKTDGPGVTESLMAIRLEVGNEDRGGLPCPSVEQMV